MRVARKLIEKSADMEVRDQRGNTPLLLAASAGFIDMLALLLAEGADRLAVNYYGDGAIARCVQSSGTSATYLRWMGASRACAHGPKLPVPRGPMGFSQRSRLNRHSATQYCEWLDRQASC